MQSLTKTTLLILVSALTMSAELAARGEIIVVWDSRETNSPPRTFRRCVDVGNSDTNANPDFNPLYRTATMPSWWNTKTQEHGPWVGSDTNTEGLIEREKEKQPYKKAVKLVIGKAATEANINAYRSNLESQVLISTNRAAIINLIRFNEAVRQMGEEAAK